jgi:hypothetical protein
MRSRAIPGVFERGSYTGERRETGVWYERREVWSLGADNRLHVVTVTRSAGESPSTRVIVYRRVEERQGVRRHAT